MIVSKKNKGIKMNKGCLLITGCASPVNGISALYLKDKNERKKQYIEAFKFYLRSTNVNRIVFCDSSSFKKPDELDEIIYRSGKRVEWLCFEGSRNLVIERGKGYGEGEIIEYAFHHSRLLSEADFLIKVTGRLIVKNIDSVIKSCKRNKNYFFPLRNVFGGNFIDTRFFIVRTDCFMEYFLKEYKNVNDQNSIFMEHIYAEVVIKNQIDVNLFRIEPDIEGISGTTGKYYHSSRSRIIIKSILNRMNMPAYLIKDRNK